jgi:hypothetical protein
MEWARAGAVARVKEVRVELAEIGEIFPDLLEEPAAVLSEGFAEPADATAKTRRRRHLSAAARARISAAQKRRWAKVRAGKKKR